MTLEEIKKVLFEKIDAQMAEYLSNKKQFGEYHEFTIPEYAKFCALYDFLEAAGLENEYLDLKYKKLANDQNQSDFYPNADNNGMVDVSDYPYTK